MSTTALDIDALVSDFEQQEPQKIIDFALEQGGDLAISFSGAEDVVLIDMAQKSGKPFRVFSLDTGRLHAETYAYLEKVREHYNIQIEIMTPKQELLQPFVREKGLYSFMRDGHKECCTVRKVEPLRRILAELDTWITGQRKDQSVDTRAHLPAIQKDPVFSGENRDLIKYNPLANWSSAQVWQYIRKNNVPYNSLHAQGFVSIGCEPCTRTTVPNQHEREGRWWWEESADKECGLHAGNK